MTLTLLIALFLAHTGNAQAQQRDLLDPTEVALRKAAYVVNFIRHTQWPEERFDDPENEDERAPIIVGILGQDPDEFDAYLARGVQTQRIHERPVEVVRLFYPAPPPGEDEVAPEVMERFRQSLRQTHVLVIARSEWRRLDEVLEMVAEADVLTVSDYHRFPDRGGMLGMVVRENRLVIEANVEAIQETGLSVTSRLLRVARIVKGPAPGPASPEG